MKTCDQLIDFVIRHVVGILGDPEAANFHRHLRECRSCRVRYRDLRQMVRPRPEAECRTCEGFLASQEAEANGREPPGASFASSRPRTAAAAAIDRPALRDAV